MSQEYYNLAQLQAMMREEAIQAFPQRIDRWKKQGYLVDAKALMRAIILATKDLNWPISDGRGCKEVWYNPMKPILMRIIRVRANKYLISFEGLLSKMVKDGYLTYLDLGISDFRTMKETHQDIKYAMCWSNILLFVEKDSAYVHLTALKKFFNINIISGHGWSNTAGIEKLLNLLASRGVTDVAVFTITDYDPFGFAIAHEFVNKCETLGLSVTEHHRVGINVEHSTPEDLKVQKYPVKRGRNLSVDGISFNSDEWLAQYGIDGVYGLEIEAVSAQPGGHQRLREIVAEELMKYLKESDRVEEITKDAWEEVPHKAITQCLESTGNDEVDEMIYYEPPKDLPKKYTTWSEYYNTAELFRNLRDLETEQLTKSILDLELNLEALRIEKEELEQPYNEKINEIYGEYQRSNKILAYCLYDYYMDYYELFPRENYDLGFPEGCLVEAVKESISLNTLIAKLSTEKPVEEILAKLDEGREKGDIQEKIDNIMKESTD